jgi:hypothetical protein
MEDMTTMSSMTWHGMLKSSPGGLTDADLLELGELLVEQDEDNVAGQYVLDTQCTTHNGNPEDCSPFPLFTSVDPAVLEIPVYVKLAALYDNYDKVQSMPTWVI